MIQYKAHGSYLNFSWLPRPDTAKKIRNALDSMRRSGQRLTPKSVAFTGLGSVETTTPVAIECEWFHHFKDVKKDSESFRRFLDSIANGTAPNTDEHMRNLGKLFGSNNEYPLQFAARLASEAKQKVKVEHVQLVKIVTVFQDAIQYVKQQLSSFFTRDKENLHKKE